MARLKRMTNQILPRGPDEEGVWFDQEAGLALGFRRLAILDLTPTGHQPMISKSGRFVLVFNGEIYNHQDLRGELEGAGILFHGRSDTEVLLEGIDRWGIASTLPRLNGMFALALWDRQERTLGLARDRFGKKPLYYGWAGQNFLFGSSLNSIRAHPAFSATINTGALAAYLRFSYVPTPHSIFSGIHKLIPGTFLELRGANSLQIPNPQIYWDARSAAMKARQEECAMEEIECEARLEELLLDAVRLRSLADVPLGAFLSGGIDSSLVVALLQKLGGSPVKTFSIGFPQKAFDEAPYAKAVAAHLGTEHTELYVESSQALDVVPLLSTIYDEPFADSSQIPTFLVSKLARQHVTVALSGDAGDELFAGYERYAVGENLLRRFAWIPSTLRRGMAFACQNFPADMWDSTVAAVLGSRNGSVRLRRLGRVLAPRPFMHTYMEMVSYWSDIEKILPGVSSAPCAFDESYEETKGLESIHQMMLMDTHSYLVDDILVKVDRASMANSLEVRNPFLDGRVFDFAWRLPLDRKWQPGNAKRILKRILHRYVPKELVDRPKMGFGIPLHEWLRGPLRGWAEELLSPQALAANGMNPLLIREAWRALIKDNAPLESQLWTVLMFQQWAQATDPSRRSHER